MRGKLLGLGVKIIMCSGREGIRVESIIFYKQKPHKTKFTFFIPQSIQRKLLCSRRNRI